LDAWAVVSVEAVSAGEDPAEGQWLATERVGGRSAWGPLLVPRLPAGLEYRIALRMGGNSSAEVRAPAPAGAELVADLRFGPGTQLLVVVKDRSSNQAVPGARLSARPTFAGSQQAGPQSSAQAHNGAPASSAPSSPTLGHQAQGHAEAPGAPISAALPSAPAIVRTSDHFGAACLVGLERHVPFEIEVTAAGFVSQRLAGLVGHEFDLSNAQRLDVWLEPAAALEGQVFIDGQPASDFEIHWSSLARTEWQRQRFTAAEQGRFRLEQAPSGGVALYASVPGRGFSPAQQSAAPAAVPLRLDITAGWTGRGLVRDGLTGAPVAGATLEWLIGDLDFPVARQPASQVSAADGSFEVSGLHSDCLRLVVSAAGYRATRVRGLTDGSGRVDFGIAELLPGGSLEVQVEGAANPQTLSVRLGWGNGGQGQPLDQQGRALLALERSSDYLTLRHRDGLEDVYFIEPQAQASGRVVLAVAPEQNLDVVALSSDPEALRSGVDTLLKWIDRRGNSVRRSVQLVQPSASARIPGIAAERVDIEWGFGQPRQSSMASFALDDSALQRLELPIGGTSWRFLIVDGAGQPLAGVQGVVYHRDGERVTRGFDFAPSDSQGLIQATRAKAGSAYVSFVSPGGAVLPDQPIQEQDFTGGPPRIVFDPNLRLELLLTSAGLPLPGARVRTETASGNVLLGSQFTAATGRLIRERLGPGRYWLFIEHQAHWPARLTVDLSASLQRSLDLPRKAPLTLRLRSGGAPLANTNLRLFPTDLPAGLELLAWPPAGLTTDEQGQLHLTAAPTGALRLECAAGSAQFSHQAGESPIELTLD
jgi:hypothetical protein